MKTQHGHALDRIAVSVVYFVPRGREPLADWHERAAYFGKRIEAFHARELAGQSQLTTTIYPEPLQSARSASELRIGDATFTFLQTIGEIERRIGFGHGAGFPVMLVLSDISWGDLDDFYRLHGAAFEGSYTSGRHFPGSPLGGSRATYVPDRGCGFALVSADGWRVPYTGSDCVVYHEVAHAFGLKHPAAADASVMSEAQYRGGLNETSINEEQKRALGWSSAPIPRDDLFSVFTAVPEPVVPKPGDEVTLKLSWPRGARETACDVDVQTALDAGWSKRAVRLGTFPKPTPVSYRVRATADGNTVELWGYFQVRATPELPPLPHSPRPLKPRIEPVDITEKVGRELEGKRAIAYDLPPAYALLLVVTPRVAEAGLVIGLHQYGKPYPVELPATWFVKARPIAIVCGVRGGGVLVTCEGETLTARTPAREEPDDAPFYIEATGTFEVTQVGVVAYG